MITSLDHLVLTVRDVAATVAFYRVLGMELREASGGRRALHFGRQKINLHVAGHEFEPKAATALPGTADLCFLVEPPIAQVVERLGAADIAIIEGPVERTGAQGTLLSVYCRDPDGNLVELSNLVS